MGTSASWWGVVVASFAGGCSLTTSFEGLSGGPRDAADDSFGADAAVADAADGSFGSDAVVADARGSDAAGAADATNPAADGAVDASIAFVQAGETDNSSGATVSLAFGRDVAAHSSIIACVTVYTTAVTLVSVTDTLRNAYTTVMGPLDGNGTRHYVVLASNVAAGPDTVTATMSANPSSYLSIHIHEYSGLADSSAFDVGSFSTGTAGGADGMKSGAKPTSANAELVFGYAISSTTAPGTGFTARTGFETGDVTEDKIVTTRGTYEATATMTSGTEWEMVMAVFKAR
jgi:hypothetical protein